MTLSKYIEVILFVFVEYEDKQGSLTRRIFYTD